MGGESSSSEANFTMGMGCRLVWALLLVVVVCKLGAAENEVAGVGSKKIVRPISRNIRATSQGKLDKRKQIKKKKKEANKPKPKRSSKKGVRRTKKKGGGKNPKRNKTKKTGKEKSSQKKKKNENNRGDKKPRRQ